MYYSIAGFPGSSDSKESTCNVGDLGSIPGLGRSPEGGHGNPLQYSCLENPHGQRSLAGYSPWGLRELDTTEQLTTAQHLSIVCIHTVHLSVYPSMDTWVASPLALVNNAAVNMGMNVFLGAFAFSTSST